MLGPFLFGSEGWKLEPHHFAERHGLIFIIALGESIVAIGVGSEAGVDAGVITAAVLGVALAATMWWAYFDVVAHRRRAACSPSGPSAASRTRWRATRTRSSTSRWSSGVVLIALGMKTTIAHVDEPLVAGDGVRAGGRSGDLPPRPHRVPLAQRPLGQQAAPRAGGRCSSRSSRSPTSPTPIVTLAIVALAMVALIAYEATHFAEARDQIRHQ